MAAKGLPHIELFDPATLISTRDDLIDLNHFKRDIYHAMYWELMAEKVA